MLEDDYDLIGDPYIKQQILAERAAKIEEAKKRRITLQNEHAETVSDLLSVGSQLSSTLAELKETIWILKESLYIASERLARMRGHCSPLAEKTRIIEEAIKTFERRFGKRFEGNLNVQQK